MTDHSQHQEQRLILDYFKDRPSGFFVDIGAADGVENSNTRALWEKGWSGILVEPMIDSFIGLCCAYNDRSLVSILNAAVSTTRGVATLKINPRYPQWASMNQKWISGWSEPAVEQRVAMVTLDDLNIPENVDLFCIDTEGMDADIIEQMPESIRPKLLIAEIDKHGAYDRINADMARRGYRRLWENVANACYERI